MLVIAHRGANKEALENSWQALSLPSRLEAERIELDVHLTRDHHLLVMHDTSLHRILGSNRLIAECNRSELAELRLQNGEPIPFLDEVFARILPRCELNVEIKTPSPLAAKLVADLIRTHQATARVVVSSFSAVPLNWLADHAPKVQIACLWGDDILWEQLHLYSPLNFMQQCRSQILHPQASFVTENLMDQARNRGWKVYPYVTMKDEDVDRESLWTHLRTLGIDGLCTNYPREFKAWLGRIEEEERALATLASTTHTHTIKGGAGGFL